MSYWKIIIPEAATNLITNPSFETGTTPWVTSGGGSPTITRIATDSRRGAFSLEVFTDGAFRGTQVVVTNQTSASTQYTLSVDIKGGIGELVILQFYDTVGGAQQSGNFTLTGDWQRIEYTATFSTGASRTVYVLGKASQTFKIDGVQLEESAYGTTYIDGDQPGCKWNGTSHASTSTRDQFEASGGQLYDLSDDLNFVIKEQDGTGMPAVNNLASPLSLQPGETFEGQTIQGRSFSLIGSITGTSVSNFHANKQALIKALNPSTKKINERAQRRTFRYTGSSVEKEIQAVYDGGLERGLPIGWSEQEITLRLLANDPFFYGVGESAVALDTNDSATGRVVAGRIDGIWDVMGPPDAAGTYSYVRTIHKGWDGKIYFGGSFSNFDNIANADNIVSYDPQTGAWAALSTGCNGVVNKIVSGPDNSIYVGGDFTTAGGVTTRGIAKWNGSSWAALGPPSSGGSVFSIVFDNSGNIYVGGTFFNWNGIANADNLAVWNGSSWAAISTGANASIYAMEFIGSDLYLAGAFTTIGGVSASKIAKYNGSSFTALGTGLAHSVAPEAWTLASSPNGLLYVGGDIDTADGITVNNVAVWNGETFEPLGSGVDDTVYNIFYHDGDLYISGDFTTASGVTLTERIARWNGSSWTNLDIDLPGSPTIYAMEVTTEKDIYVGYSTAGTLYYASNTAVSYLGTGKAYPYIKIKRSGGTTARLYSITNWTTGAELFFDYPLLNGEELIINTRPGQQSITSSFRGDIYNKLLPNSDFGAFYLVPGNGSSAQDNVITAFVSTTGSPTITANMIWKNVYTSED